ncbi:hypothetical protein HL658_07150 [Azospirillum sp. RWY-5-1]|uniref:Methyl-accepting chemotaxis protein n=1 Tax=Azospirillum oleiclasticum TaxID=2735135 RepID=A0ABX2T6S1_9PROT|nr:hypothetical protein [Azospirillum oleiclasticum]NYZ12320.1 hypothetical protein [Azospirillum oleiclasticum]NYZ19480.1 hypothetical protein [Azospirillum oleiclasticum]
MAERVAASPRRRRPIAALGGALIAVFLVNGLIGLFAIQHERDSDMAEQAMEARLETALDTARTAQVAFKIQVQEWKNILLRGGDPVEFDRFLRRFEEQERAVARALATLKDDAATLDIDAATPERLLADHATLAARYRGALPLFDRADPASVRAVDTAVRGIDRPLDQGIDGLAEALRRRAAAVRMEQQAQAADRYATLRAVSLASLLAGLALIGVILVRGARAG